ERLRSRRRPPPRRRAASAPCSRPPRRCAAGRTSCPTGRARRAGRRPAGPSGRWGLAVSSLPGQPQSSSQVEVLGGGRPGDDRQGGAILGERARATPNVELIERDSEVAAQEQAGARGAAENGSPPLGRIAELGEAR